MSPRRIELRIDELVLDGYPARDARPIVGAAERELGRLLASESGWPAVLRRDAELVLDGFDPPRGSSADEVGTALARTLHDGLKAAGHGRPRP